jgi:coniferyl-aldehyde dehydrogenase
MSDTSTSTLDELFATQKQAFAAETYPTLEVRLDRLRRLEACLVRNRKPIQDALIADFGTHHPLATDLFETGGVLGRNRTIQAMLPEWMGDSERALLDLVHGSSRARVIRQPKGVMGNIAPWNFPIECALVMVNEMLGAGNRVIVKASEFTPSTGALLANIIAEAFDRSELAVVNGGVELSRYFSALPWDHLTYTGGAAAARAIMAAAAPNLTPLTLELGGKNPTVFLPEAVEPGLVERYLYFRIFKGGQVCTSPDYVMVPRGQMEEWVTIAKAQWSKMYPHYVGHPDATGTINRRHFDRILGYVEEARAAGVEVVSLNGDEPDAETLQIPMYAVIDPPAHLAVSQDEVFGPVVAVLPYDTLEDAIAEINRRPRPLAAYIAGRDQPRLDQFARHVIAGGIGINVFGFQGAEPALPFGGIGASGMGCHSGIEGFLQYTHQKSVFDCADDNPLMLALAAPYGDFAQQFADAIFPAA